MIDKTNKKRVTNYVTLFYISMIEEVLINPFSLKQMQATAQVSSIHE